MSLAIANGAVAGASIITTTLGTVGDLFSGNPVIQITDTTFFSTDESGRESMTTAGPGHNIKYNIHLCVSASCADRAFITK